MRHWQLDFKKHNRNYLAPCPNRDHHDEIDQLLRKHEPDPTDVNATETLTDPGYTAGLVAYNQEFEAITHEILGNHYVHRSGEQNGSIAPLPGLPEMEEEKATVE